MSSRGVRWWLLAEDKRHERLALELANRLRLNDRPVSVSIAPSGHGAASASVRLQYAQVLRTTIRKRPGERVALLVMVDGDNRGVVLRKQELDEGLRAANEPLRADNEPAAVLIPTWSVETWLLIPPATSEATSFKDQLREPGRPHFEQAVARLLSPGEDDLPSIIDGARELSRIKPD